MEIVKSVSYFVLPFILFLVGVIILFGKKDYFAVFLIGAKRGFSSSLKLIPTMCALVVGVSMLSASGALEVLSNTLGPAFDFIGIPSELLPLILTRPLSFGASLASFNEIIRVCGVDSLVGLCASVIMASSDTAIYVMSVYFASSGIKKTRFALGVCLLSSLFCIILSCILCRVFF